MSSFKHGNDKAIQAQWIRSKSNTPYVGAHSSNGSKRLSRNKYVYDYRNNHSHKRSAQTLITLILSIIYWPFVIIGIASPFIEGFNFGTLDLWQVVLSRILISFIALGIPYVLAVNIGGIRRAAFLQRNRVLKTVLLVVAGVFISFVLIRIVCIF